MQFLVGLLSFCLGISVVLGAAEECYSCDREGCRDTFNPNNLGVVKITSLDGWCVKTSGKVLGETGVTIRNSATNNICVSNDCDRITYQNNDFDFCCCNKNLCNDARPISTGRTLIIVTFCLSLAFALIWIN